MISLADIAAKKRELDALKGSLRQGGLDGLDHSQRIDITYTSNAIEGNTLTAGEIALVLEKGITVGGKPLKDYVQAVDHYQALEWASAAAIEDQKGRKIRSITEPTVRVINYMLLRRTRGELHQAYADLPKDSSLEEQMTWKPPAISKLCAWLRGQSNTPMIAAEAYDRLAETHPFLAGNGPTSQLLLNYILLRGGYPPISISLSDLGDDRTDSQVLVFRKLNETLDLYLGAARQGQVIGTNAKLRK